MATVKVYKRANIGEYHSDMLTFTRERQYLPNAQVVRVEFVRLAYYAGWWKITISDTID